MRGGRLGGAAGAARAPGVPGGRAGLTPAPGALQSDALYCKSGRVNSHVLGSVETVVSRTFHRNLRQFSMGAQGRRPSGSIRVSGTM
ncbi:hypothetical protein E5288_WYG014825 [Bos mutus]|uniref:Uncharacterized protein n=1 Tax=Bos mutus TaxID=72004 RepID=A0A6B0RZ19_9CETA|nr:hypothetical protein [Bos mutus]